MKLLQAKLSQYTAPQEAKAAGIYPYFRAISSEQDPEVVIDGKKVLMFGSNCYTGLVNDPRIKEAAIEATRKYGTGCAGSPFLNGTLDLHKKLEAAIAEYIGKEDVMIYSSGFEVNLGVVSALTGREDYILWDEQDHASIIEGRRLSFSQSLKYKHNDMEDEAHGIGVFGEGGRGVCHHYGVAGDVDLIMGTFSKSFASLGGFIATDKEITNFLRHHSRSYIFTASITPASTAAALKAIEIMKAEPERQEHLWEITNYALDGFRNMGCEIGPTSTPIIPLFIRDNFKTFAITRDLLEEGIFVNPVVSPAVAPHDTLIRFSLMATHSKEQVTTALEKIQKVFKAHGIIS